MQNLGYQQKNKNKYKIKSLIQGKEQDKNGFNQRNTQHKQRKQRQKRK